MRTAADYPYFDTPFCALAHRGGSLLAANVGRENSLAAMRAAVSLGFTHVETDVHATADGHLVAFHDDTLERVTDGRGRIADLPLREVRRHLIGGREPVPTLDEVLEELPSTRFNIDIKAPGAVRPLVHALNRHRAQDRVNVGSFGVDRIRAFRRLMGEQVPTAASGLGTAWTSLVPGLPRLLPSTGVVLQVPVSWPVAGRRVPIVTPRLIHAAHARGRQVHVWTVDDEAEMERLIGLGVDGIVTDRPDVLREVLLRRGLWH